MRLYKYSGGIWKDRPKMWFSLGCEATSNFLIFLFISEISNNDYSAQKHTYFLIFYPCLNVSCFQITEIETPDHF